VSVGITPIKKVPDSPGAVILFIEQLNRNFTELNTQIAATHGSAPNVLYVEPGANMLNMVRINFASVRDFLVGKGRPDMGFSVEYGPLTDLRLQQLNDSFYKALAAI